MAKAKTSFLRSVLTITIFIITSSPRTTAQSSSKYNAVVLPVYKDTLYSLYKVPSFRYENKIFVLDLATPLTWTKYSDDHNTIPCNSPDCTAAHSYTPPTCPKVTYPKKSSQCNCTAYFSNPKTGACGSGDLTKASADFLSTDGNKTISPVTVSDIAVSCAPSATFKGLPSTTLGVVGLAKSSTISLPQQLSAKLKMKNKFGLCLPSSRARSPGVALFGNGPFYLQPPPGINIYKSLTYTNLIKGSSSNPGYYLNVQGIAINQQQVDFSYSMNKPTDNAVLISTTHPVSVLRSDIYKPFLEAFSKATSKIPRNPNRAPYDLCFKSTALGSTLLGYGVPQIDIMLPGSNNWTIFGANSLIDVSNDTACFAFVAGSKSMSASAILGGYQLENNFLMFDFAKMNLGFSGLLFGRRTTCSNFLPFQQVN